jgi:hypothetical protein
MCSLSSVYYLRVVLAWLSIFVKFIPGCDTLKWLFTNIPCMKVIAFYLVARVVDAFHRIILLLLECARLTTAKCKRFGSKVLVEVL